MDLPRNWPGRMRVRQVLTFMRLTGHWNRELQDYAALSKQRQRQKYRWLREIYYWTVHHKHPDWTRIGR